MNTDQLLHKANLSYLAGDRLMASVYIFMISLGANRDKNVQRVRQARKDSFNPWGRS